MSEDPHQSPPISTEKEEPTTFAMEMIMEDQKEDQTMKVAWCVALYVALALIWLPGFSLEDDIYDVTSQTSQPKKRKVLRPPPEKIERVQVQKKKNKKVPMPDMTPDEPEPIVPPDPLPMPDLLETDDWEIGIPDGPPVQDTVARVGDQGVDPPVFTRKVQPKYPDQAVKIKLQGYVILEAILRKDGSVDNIKVLRGLGKGKFGFEDEAIKALRQWEFLPGKVNGKPEDVRMSLQVSFVIY